MKKQLPNEVLMPEVERMLQAGLTVRLTVRGNSMNPFLRDGRDGVVLTACDSASLRCGDVVLARELHSERYLLHRIVGIDKDEIMLQGDGNVKMRERTSRENICGLMVAIERNGRQYEVGGRRWRVYSRCWILLTPLRRVLLALYRRLGFLLV